MTIYVALSIWLFLCIVPQSEWRSSPPVSGGSEPSFGNAGPGSTVLLILIFLLGLFKPVLNVLILPCSLILLLMMAFIGLSCFLGVYFTVYTTYGYSMGDSFTLAGFVLAIGTLACGSAMAMKTL